MKLNKRECRSTYVVVSEKEKLATNLNVVFIETYCGNVWIFIFLTVSVC